MTSRTRFIAILVSAPVIAFTVIGGLLGHAMARADDTYANLRVFNDVVSLIMSNYVEQPNMESVMRGAMRGLAEGLDSDSAYLTQAQVRQFESGDQAASADVGITLTHQVLPARCRDPRRLARRPRPVFVPATSSGWSICVRRATCRRSRASGCSPGAAGIESEAHRHSRQQHRRTAHRRADARGALRRST